MPERDLKLNAIRYSKQSPRLVLEEHGHCEVPAGCGGVVLRWRDRALLPVDIWFDTCGEAQLYLDGGALASSRQLIAPGDHVLAIRIRGAETRDGIFMCAGIHGEDVPWSVRYSTPSGRTFLLVSLADGTWKYTTDEPADDSWMRPGYDDARWSPMLPRALPVPAQNEYGRSYRVKKLLEKGACGLGIGHAAASVCVRKSFTLPPVSPSPESSR
jgi:hypothetical protein